jgi:hypothetical protein
MVCHESEPDQTEPDQTRAKLERAKFLPPLNQTPEKPRYGVDPRVVLPIRG